MVNTTHLAFIVAALLSSCTAAPPSQMLHRAATAERSAEITALIRTRTQEPILSMKQLSPDSVEVTTGHQGFDSGGGKEFELRKTRGKWKIVEERIWMV